VLREVLDLITPVSRFFTVQPVKVVVDGSVGDVALTPFAVTP
jgi:hypothetical protein